MHHLNRKAAPLDEATWQQIDAAAVSAARGILTARRFLEVDGPFGIGLTTLGVGDDEAWQDQRTHEVDAVVSRALPVPLLRRGFRLGLRRLAMAAEGTAPLDLNAVEEAAEDVARREEALVYHGDDAFNLAGLLTAPGHQEVGGGDWDEGERAVEDVISALKTLDNAGFPGPYALVVAPALHAALLRRYGDTDMLQYEHLERICRRGIHKAAIRGAAVVDPRAGRIVVGQDLAAGFAAQDGVHLQLFLVESVVCRVDEPRAVCTITR